MGTLHVVATPIGNLEDVTLRALRVLGEADVVYAEDTRRTRVLLDRHGLAARLVSLHAHNEPARISDALARLASGERVALVTDAGTPVVSDPGGRLVEAAAEAGHVVEAAPGPSAVLAALTVCGLRVTSFTFIGFPPRRSGARRKLFGGHAVGEPALVLFESPARLGATLADLASAFGAERRAAVARELTKLHEEVARGTLGELVERFAERPRGEITVVVEGVRAADVPRVAEIDDDEVDRSIAELAASGLRAREIAATLAERTGLPRRDLYSRAVAVLNAEKPGPAERTRSAETAETAESVEAGERAEPRDDPEAPAT